ncbi:hypothetical protein ALC60_03579 [Trachymyrmex zeteki]|uniref:Uncharacterized protein n=1 Tax=Mycetomoellerius zeteki TaxID=64791 RepID=A0A151XB89_9HYME|nr:hypothetical protein ALC60_03579 [Trachymyrmex zeteki]
MYFRARVISTQTVSTSRRTKKHDDLGGDYERRGGSGERVVARGWPIGNVKCRLRGLTTHDEFVTRCVAKIRITNDRVEQRPDRHVVTWSCDGPFPARQSAAAKARASVTSSRSMTIPAVDGPENRRWSISACTDQKITEFFASSFLTLLSYLPR